MIFSVDRNAKRGAFYPDHFNDQREFCHEIDARLGNIIPVVTTCRNRAGIT